MSDHLIVVSADCHAGLPIADYKPYVESKYHEMMDMAVPITIEMMDKAESTFLIKEINDAWRAPIKKQLTVAAGYGAGIAVGWSHGSQSLAGRMVR